MDTGDDRGFLLWPHNRPTGMSSSLFTEDVLDAMRDVS